MPMNKTPVTQDGLVWLDDYGSMFVTNERGFSYGIRDTRDKTCLICERGWECNGPSMSDQVYWSLLEDTVHASCLNRHESLVERVRFIGIVSKFPTYNGKRTLKVETNEYSSDGTDWYSLEIRSGIKLFMGWRKNVCNISIRCEQKDDWFDRVLFKLMDAWSCEAVTKSFSSKDLYIHAWGWNKVEEYISTIAKVVSSQQD